MMSMSTDNIVILQRKACSPMRTLSSLELMLDRIQQRDADQLAGQDGPPALPPRPVSNARTPPGRRRAVPLPLPLPFHFQEVESNGGGNEEGRKPRMLKGMRTKRETCLQEPIQECGFRNTLNKIGIMNGAAESAVLQGVILVQKCFRRQQARCHYHELKRAIITLQSFVRGENERKNYEVSVKKPKRDQDHVQVPYSEVAQLQMRVLRAEAALGVKNEENTALQLRLEQCDRKWQQYEAKMKSMEKLWQDQLAAIQARLAARNGSRACEIPDIPQNGGPQRANGRVYTIKHFIEQHERGMEDDDSNSDPSGLQRVEPEKELRKLNVRFNSWNKNYKTRLRETKTKLDRLEVHSRVKKCHKWW